MIFLATILALCAGHALCDYPLQGDFLALGKNHRNPKPGFPAWQLLLAHCLIQAGMVMVVVTLSRLCAGQPLRDAYQMATFLACAELIIHLWADWGKCEGISSFNQDQLIHYLCKFVWAGIACL